MNQTLWRVLAAMAVVLGVLSGVFATPIVSANGSTLYVATPANGGSDSGNCQSASAPCATLAYAVSQASSGDTIDVGPGTFTANLSNALGVSLTIQGSTSGDAAVTTIEPVTNSTPVFAADRGGWTLEQVTVNGLSGDALSTDYGSLIDVVDSTVTNSARAMCVCGPTGTFAIKDSTISGNTIGVDVSDASGGGNITSSTIASNGVGLGGYAFGFSVAATIVSNNTQDCSLTSAPLTDAGYNLDDDGSCGFSPTNHSDSDVNPQLGTLQDNGGPTLTMSPSAGSPVLDQIPSGATGNGITLCPGTDQRGAPRPESQKCDIGAVEPEFSTTSCSTGTTCTTNVVTPTQTVAAVGTKGTGVATVTVSVAPGTLTCGAAFSYEAPVTTLTDTGLKPGTSVLVTATVNDLPSKKGVLVCYEPVEASPPAATLLGKCHGAASVPCEKSVKEVGGSVVAKLLVPEGDPRFHIGGEAPEVTSFSPTTVAPGKKLSIVGLNLSEVTKVTIGGVSVPITKTAPTKVTVVVPTTSHGGVVVVTSLVGTSSAPTSVRVT
jgi:hypothetical protein